MWPISREDYPTLFRWRSSMDDIHMLNFRRRIATFEEFVRELEPLLASGGMILLVRGAKNGQPIGYALAYNVNQWDGSLGVGLYTETRYRVRGHGGEAALLYVDFLFRNFPLKKMTTEIYEFAVQTLQLVRQMGTEEVGLMPDHFWHGDRYWGVHYMVLTRERWKEYREDFAAILDVQQRFAVVSDVSTDGHPVTGGVL